MRLHRFYIDFRLEHERETIKNEALIHQWRNVFRYNVGSEVILFDGNGKEYSAVIEKLGNREGEVRLVSERDGIVPERNIILYQSLIKKDKMEWVVEKSTELGVSKIIPIVSERSEKKGFNIERAKKIAVEASEQCGRADVPEVFEVTDLSEALENCNNPIIFDKSGPAFDPSLISKNYKPVSIFIGPEGGWTEKELELFKQKGTSVHSLGSLTLRAETAALTAIAMLSLGRL